MKVRFYKVNVYQAFRADEEGVRWFTHEPSDDLHYKHETLEEKEIELPNGITYDDKFEWFSDNGHDCALVTEKDGSLWLISCERMVKLL